MKAIIYTETGDSSVLQLVDREVPQPPAGEVRIRVHVSGVNPTDWKSRRGGSGAPLSAPEVTPNQDGSGVIDALGEGVTGFTVGQPVWTLLSQYQRSTGTAQEYVVLPVSRVAPLPEGAGFDIGASLGVPAVTAHRALTVSEDGPDRLHPGAMDGLVVLVAGGAGAVGHAAIQLARWAGATVITTVSGPAKAALATAAGAHHAVNYTEGDPAAAIRAIAPDGVHLIVEVAPARNADLNHAVAAPRATISIYANDGSTGWDFNVMANMRLNTRYQFVLLYTVGQQALDNAIEDVNAAVTAGALPVGEAAGLPLHRFPLEQTAAAHDAVEAAVVGKVLIDIP
ncbi:MAG: Bifunctional protein: zinc-containing alcohol dehydrogenase quinone oxidoreductase [Pseudonocardiales bacterium]|nr:Bifunctional protein: zinc-containing alcohol dehydrogenase quinone oxidoreductase [Jatrophihabitantaceae bacterium]MCW2603904.1 Bifunctional protein: zinc-containing alcohol dehydrogenase quinone oxidoreductase [Pseudonocardiales bacterium]